MKIYDCKCTECKAEFQAVMSDAKETVNCPSCNSEKVKKTETDQELGCGSGCASCGGCK